MAGTLIWMPRAPGAPGKRSLVAAADFVSPNSVGTVLLAPCDSVQQPPSCFWCSDFTDELANEALDVNSAVKTVSEALHDPAWQKYVEDGIVGYNNSVQCPSNAQKIQKFRFLPTDLSIPGGELTATMKIKRGFVVEKYANLIESMYT